MSHSKIFRVHFSCNSVFPCLVSDGVLIISELFVNTYVFVRKDEYGQ